MWYTNIKRLLKETALEVKKEKIIIFFFGRHKHYGSTTKKNNIYLYKNNQKKTEKNRVSHLEFKKQSSYVNNFFLYQKK